MVYIFIKTLYLTAVITGNEKSGSYLPLAIIIERLHDNLSKHRHQSKTFFPYLAHTSHILTILHYCGNNFIFMGNSN